MLFTLCGACPDLNYLDTRPRVHRREVPGNVVHTVHIDLADLSSVKDCAARLSAQDPFDVLMLNAGVCISCQGCLPRGVGHLTSPFGAVYSLLRTDCREGSFPLQRGLGGLCCVPLVLQK